MSLLPSRAAVYLSATEEVSVAPILSDLDYFFVSAPKTPRMLATSSPIARMLRFMRFT